jgi:hypothetical protein
MAFPPTLNLFGEVALIAVIYRNAISSSDVSRQVALQSHHEVGLISARRAMKSNVTILSET